MATRRHISLSPPGASARHRAGPRLECDKQTLRDSTLGLARASWSGAAISCFRGVSSFVFIFFLAIGLSNPTLGKIADRPGTPKKPATEVKRLSDDNLLILKVELRPYLLADGMPAFQNFGSIMLPLGELAQSLEFPIGVDIPGRRASGWFLNENQFFSLDIDKSEVVIAGKPTPFNRALIDINEEDIFVDVRLLSKWFPLDIEFDLPNLMVLISSREPLPVEQKLARSERRERLIKVRRRAKGYPKLKNPHQWISWPTTDTSMEFSVRQKGGERTQFVQHNTIATADIGKLNGEFFIAGDDDDKISQARLKLGRKDVDGNMLGPFKVSEFAFGDIYTPQVPLISKTQIGRGFTVSNFPINQPTEFDRITLTGDLALGWEIELYRNEVLLDFRVSQSDGTYRFENVPLLFGVNVLRLVFYGPQGQVREKVKHVRIGPDQVKTAEQHFRLSVNQQDRQFLLGDVDGISDVDLQGKTRYFAEYETGLTRNISLAGSLSSVPITDGHRMFASLGGRAVMGDIFGRFDMVRDLSKGWAGKLALQTSLFGVNLTAEHDRFYDFVSEQFAQSADPIEHQTEVRMDGVARLMEFPHVPFSLKATHEQNRSGNTSTGINNRLSSAIGALSLTHTLDYQLNNTEASRSMTVNGTFLVGGRIKDIKLRGQLGYGIEPIGNLTNSSVTAEWQINNKYNAEIGFDKDLSDNGITTYSGGLNMLFPIAAVGVNMNYDSTRELNARLTMSFSTARDPKSGDFHVRSTRLSETGTMTARVFFDQNFNGIFDKGDTPLKGVGFNAGRSQLAATTDKNGMAFVTGIDAYRPVEFAVASATLEDPYWISQPEGVTVILRSGTSKHMDFPVVATGEIDGVVYKRTGEWASEVSEAIVQLVDAKGDIVKETKSSYDGFFLLDLIVPGKYKLRIDPDQIKRINLLPPPARDVVIKGAGTILNGMDFVLASNVTGDRTYRLLLTSFATREQAEVAWKSVVAGLPREFAGLKPAYETEKIAVAKEGTLIVYNLFASGFPERDAAVQLCKQVQKIKSQIWCNPLTIQTQ